MTGDAPAVRQLARLPRSDRRDALAALVAAEFRAALLMTEDEELSLEDSFFDLGLSSLRLTELKERLEALLGRPISANELFNRPTVARLLDHLTERVLGDLFGDAPVATAGRNEDA
jgi:acyl carrier protein